MTAFRPATDEDRRLSDALDKLHLEPGDILFVDGRAVGSNILRLLMHPIYRVAGKTIPPDRHLAPGNIIECDDPASLEIVGNRIVVVHPESGQSVQDCIYSMSRAELGKLTGEPK